LRNAITGEEHTAGEKGLSVEELFATVPVALLVRA
jgi:hypothetical protein